MSYTLDYRAKRGQIRSLKNWAKRGQLAKRARKESLMNNHILNFQGFADWNATGIKKNSGIERARVSLRVSAGYIISGEGTREY